MTTDAVNINSLLIANNFACSILADLGALLKENKRVYRHTAKRTFNALYAKLEKNNEDVRFYMDKKISAISMLDLYDAAEETLYPYFNKLKHAYLDALEEYNVTDTNILATAYALRDEMTIAVEAYEELAKMHPFLRNRRGTLCINKYSHQMGELLDILWQSIASTKEPAPQMPKYVECDKLKSVLCDVTQIRQSINSAIEINEKTQVLKVC